MAKIMIDDREYDLETLSADARAQIQNLQFVEAELARLQAQMAVAQTARMAYQTALKSLLAQAN